MRLRVIGLILTLALLAAIPATASAADSTTIGTGTRTCTLAPGADCHGVVHRWTVEHHGDLHGINLRNADLRGADLRGVDLHGADLRGTKFRHADLRDANLKGAKFGSQRKHGKHTRIDHCVPICQGADLSYANLSGADLTSANLTSVKWYSTTCPDGEFTYVGCPS